MKEKSFTELHVTNYNPATMETVQLQHDIQLLTLQAKSFPEGVAATFEQLEQATGHVKTRTLYGISYPNQQGAIQYYAAANTVRADETAAGTESFTIKKGPFATLLVRNWQENVPAIKVAFMTLMEHPAIDPKGYCLEEYMDPDVRCLVTLRQDYVPAQGIRLHAKLAEAFDAFYTALDRFDGSQLNKVPQAGGWNAGQVAEHIIASVEHLPDSKTAAVNRFADQHVQQLADIFLNFEVKMESPDFILPKTDTHEKAPLLETLREIQARHIIAADTLDLTALCMDFEFPGAGYLTRYELLNFYVFHTLRHTRQLENIFAAIIA